MKIGLLGTGFGIAHAGIYQARPDIEAVVVFGRTPARLERFAEQFGFATTTDVDRIYGDEEIDLVDVCLPTPVHADYVVRALAAGKDVLCELPLASTMADAERIVEAQRAGGRHVFVDMFGRFDPSNEFLQAAVSEGTYGTLETLEIATRTARLWEGYPLRLDSIAMDVMHSSLDTIVTALGAPASMSAVGTGRESAGSAAEVLLTYPGAIAVCSASALMPVPYGVRGGYRAVLSGGVLESAWTAGYEGSGPTVLTEYTEEGAREIDLPESQGYAAVIEHVMACREGRATSRIAPESVLDALRLTLDVQNTLTAHPEDLSLAGRRSKRS